MQGESRKGTKEAMKRGWGGLGPTKRLNDAGRGRQEICDL